MAIDKYTLKDGSTRYRVSVYMNGQRVAQKRGFKTKKEAKNYEASVRIKGARAGIKTYDEVEKLYIASIETSHQGSTVYVIEKSLRANVPEAWRKRKIDSIKAPEVQRVVNAIASRCKSGSVYVSRIANVFEYAKDMGYITVNPFNQIKKPKTYQPDPDSRWALWTPEQYARFLEEAKRFKNPLAYPLFRLYLYTGMRHGEATAFTWDDFDYETCTFDLTKADGRDRHGHHIVKEPKNDSKRKIVVDQETADAIEALRPFAVSDRIFPLSYDVVSIWFKAIEKRAGLPHSRLHNFRVEHCNVLLSNGAYIKDVQQRVGHKNAQTTINTYARANRNLGEVLEYLPKNHYTEHYSGQ